jgi:hypothetical protein
MKYFIDTEFIEGFNKPMLGKRRHFIDLISIGIVAEDGREYYAISTEFNPKDADDWVRKNVISKLPDRYVDYHDSPRRKRESLLWKSNSTISFEVQQFMNGTDAFFGKDFPEIYAYYADYDWVVFCSLFGRMIDLPKGFPMYCRDLKQMMDEKVTGFTNSDYFTHFHQKEPLTFDEKLKLYKSGPKFPQQENEHSALDDARWNKKLYEYITPSPDIKEDKK